MDKRYQIMHDWLQSVVTEPILGIQPASDDASFRRYFRLQLASGNVIVMDAPPEHENVVAFCHIAELLSQAGVNVPEIFAKNSEQGFLLLSDLGHTMYLDKLSKQTVETLYADALSTLAVLQCTNSTSLPTYDARLLQAELALFPEWLVSKYLNIELAFDYQACCQVLMASALAQPVVFVHRDYHSRNLMISAPFNPAIIDFQDAVAGPVTYDLVSLLRDCYIQWPEAQVTAWVQSYYQLATAQGIIEAIDFAQFLRWFDLMGVQRHLKAAGIFARLALRDNKKGYLEDIPRTLNHIVSLKGKYASLAPLITFIEQVLMKLEDK